MVIGIFPLAIFGYLVLYFVFTRFIHGKFDNASGRFIDYRQLLKRRPKISRDEDFEVYIYRLADKFKGRLRSAQIVVASGLPLSEVEIRMSKLVDNVHIRMEVDDSGIISYEFPELL